MRRSRVYALPDAVREELNARLVSSGFGSYEALATWLREQGHEISRSALHRYGQDLEEEFDTAMLDVRRTTELARAAVAAAPDDSAALVDATTRIAQEHLLRIVIGLRKAAADPEAAAKPLAQVSRALADLGRLSLSHRKHAAQMQATLTQKVDEATASGAPLTADAFKALVREVYGG